MATYPGSDQLLAGDNGQGGFVVASSSQYIPLTPNEAAWLWPQLKAFAEINEAGRSPECLAGARLAVEMIKKAMGLGYPLPESEKEQP